VAHELRCTASIVLDDPSKLRVNGLHLPLQAGLRTQGRNEELCVRVFQCTYRYLCIVCVCVCVGITAQGLHRTLKAYLSTQACDKAMRCVALV
jgi:hypothetical protein